MAHMTIFNTWKSMEGLVVRLLLVKTILSVTRVDTRNNVYITKPGVDLLLPCYYLKNRKNIKTNGNSNINNNNDHYNSNNINKNDNYSRNVSNSTINNSNFHEKNRQTDQLNPRKISNPSSKTQTSERKLFQTPPVDFSWFSATGSAITNSKCELSDPSRPYQSLSSPAHSCHLVVMSVHRGMAGTYTSSQCGLYRVVVVAKQSKCGGSVVAEEEEKMKILRRYLEGEMKLKNGSLKGGVSLDKVKGGGGLEGRLNGGNDGEKIKGEIDVEGENDGFKSVFVKDFNAGLKGENGGVNESEKMDDEKRDDDKRDDEKRDDNNMDDDKRDDDKRDDEKRDDLKITTDSFEILKRYYVFKLECSVKVYSSMPPTTIIIFSPSPQILSTPSFHNNTVSFSAFAIVDITGSIHSSSFSCHVGIETDHNVLLHPVEPCQSELGKKKNRESFQTKQLEIRESSFNRNIVIGSVLLTLLTVLVVALLNMSLRTILRRRNRRKSLVNSKVKTQHISNYDFPLSIHMDDRDRLKRIERRMTEPFSVMEESVGRKRAKNTL